MSKKLKMAKNKTQVLISNSMPSIKRRTATIDLSYPMFHTNVVESLDIEDN